MTCQDSFHEVAFNISFWTRNISSARILFWRGVCIKEMHYIKLELFSVAHDHNLHESASRSAIQTPLNLSLDVTVFVVRSKIAKLFRTQF